MFDPSSVSFPIPDKNTSGQGRSTLLKSFGTISPNIPFGQNPLLIKVPPCAVIWQHREGFRVGQKGVRYFK
jgi:hypothetical protein